MEQQVKEYTSLVEVLDELEHNNAPKGQMWHNMIRFLDTKARAKGVPFGAALELTPLCNLDCKMCYVHLTGKQLLACGKEMLTGDQWIDLIDQAAEAGMMHVLLTGGEAMMHPDFDRIYLHLLSKGMLITINTNGVLLTEERVAFFKRHAPSMIQVSLYGSNDAEYEQVTGHRVFSKVMDGIRRLKENNLIFEVGFTPSRYMADCGKSLMKLLDSMKLFFSMNTGLFTPRTETGRAEGNHDLSLDEYVELYRLRAQLQGREYTSVCQADVRPVGGSSDEEPKGFRCSGGRSSFAITWSGALQPCLMVNEIQQNLLETSFSAAWKQLHHQVMEYPFPQECIGCSYQHICTVCIKQHAMGAPAGHANKALCERAQRLALEGMIKRGV